MDNLNHPLFRDDDGTALALWLVHQHYDLCFSVAVSAITEINRCNAQRLHAKSMSELYRKHADFIRAQHDNAPA